MAVDWKVEWSVFVNGQDMTSRMKPYVIDITVTDKADDSSDSCALTFDDKDAQIKLPQPGSVVVVLVSGVRIFEGVTVVPRSKGDRSSGRTVSVTAKGFDTAGKAKEPQTFHADDSSLQAFLDKAAANAGFDIRIDEGFAAINRDYWAADGESFLQIGKKLAHELHGTFKIRGRTAVLVRRGQGLAPGGTALPVITGKWGVNLISWDVSPRTPRRTFGRAEVRYFDRQSAQIKSMVTDFANGGEASNLMRGHTADEAQAEQIGEARKRETDREGGEGQAVIDIEPRAQAECTFILSGARPGIDGSYRVDSVTQRVARGSGSTTSLSFKQPGDGAGEDSRA